jgi:DNA helicase-4
MIFILGIIAIAALLYFVIFLPWFEQKKYQNTTYRNTLEQLSLFFDTIDQFNDYVTWVQRDAIKKQFAAVGNFFKNKSTFYKKEAKVKEFNAVFQDFDRYILDYNKNYVQSQKEKLRDYFDDVEGKKLDDQQRTAILTDEYSNLIIAGAGSGKTLTILGKVKYLPKKQWMN